MNHHWELLNQELSEFAQTRGSIRFWWRDDDASEYGDELNRLLRLSRDYKIPLALAVIPGRLKENLVSELMGESTDVLQHGCHHVNLASAQEKKCEMLLQNSVIDCLPEFRSFLKDTFENRFTSILVPPWNRIAEQLLPRLKDMGFVGVSTFKSRVEESMFGLKFINTHIDIVDWKGTRGFAGEERILADIVNALKLRRSRTRDSHEPIGLLTHHLDHDELCWDFIERLFDFTQNHSSVRWERIHQLLEEG